MIKAMIYRLYPTPAQDSRLHYYLYIGRKIYNEGLEQRIKYYAETGKGLKLYDQLYDFTILRNASLVLKDIPITVGHDAYNRLDGAFQRFFKRVRQGNKKPGFPRFKSWNRWNSFTVVSSCMPKKLIQHGCKVFVAGIGLISGRNVRLFTGKAKCMRIVHKAGKWYAKVVVDDGLEPPPIKSIIAAVGIDLGLESFATLSNGEKIDNPRFYRKMEKKLAKAQRNQCRKVIGSANRRKAIREVQRIHVTIANQRDDFTHHLSKRIVNEYQLIGVEDLSIKSMVRGRFAKSIYDAAWGQFISRLSYKAESAGCFFTKVPSQGTSQDCSRCPETVIKSLYERTHSCTRCGLVLDRDHNAAINVLQLGIQAAKTSGLGTRIGNACGSVSSGFSHVTEVKLTDMKQEAPQHTPSVTGGSVPQLRDDFLPS